MSELPTYRGKRRREKTTRLGQAPRSSYPSLVTRGAFLRRAAIDRHVEILAAPLLRMAHPAGDVLVRAV